MSGRVLLEHILASALAAARRIRASRFGRLPWGRGAACFSAGAAIVAVTLIAGAIHYIYFDRANLPDLEAFYRFEFPTVGHVYDINGQTIAEMATEYRRITTCSEIPPIVRDAVLAAEDKNFFSITPQLFRGHLLKAITARENSDQLRHGQGLARLLARLIGARTVNMMFRKLEEIRLSFWIEGRNAGPLRFETPS